VSRNYPDAEPCGAVKDDGTTCQLQAGWGTNHVGYGQCKLHLGSTRNHVKAARREQLMAAAALYGMPRVVDPNEALLEVLYAAAGSWDFFISEVNDLDTPWITQRVPGGFRIDEHPALTAADRAFKNYMKIVDVVAKVDIDKRQLQINEIQAIMMAKLVTQLLDAPELALTKEQRDMGRMVAGKQLRALEVKAS
jgi:hypothetical protein